MVQMQEVQDMVKAAKCKTVRVPVPVQIFYRTVVRRMVEAHPEWQSARLTYP